MAVSQHLAIDLGASSGRVALGTLEDGRLSTRILHRFPNGGVPVPGPGGMRLYWDVLGLWQGVLHGLRLAAAEGIQIASVGVNSWAVDYALLDRHGALLGGGIRHYRDTRTGGQMERAFALVELVEERRIAAIEVAHAVGEIGFGSSQVDVKVVVEQRDGEDSPTAAACDALEEPPPVTAVVVIEHDVSSIEAALGDVLDSVGNVEAVGARHGRRPAAFGLRVTQ